MTLGKIPILPKKNLRFKYSRHHILPWQEKAEAVEAVVEKAAAVHGMHQVRLGTHLVKVEETTLQGKSESSNFTIFG